MSRAQKLLEAKREVLSKDGYKVLSFNSDEDGSEIEVTYKGKLVLTGIYDPHSGSFGVNPVESSAHQKWFNNAADLIPYAKKFNK